MCKLFRQLSHSSIRAAQQCEPSTGLLALEMWRVRNRESGKTRIGLCPVGPELPHFPGQIVQEFEVQAGRSEFW